MHSEKLCSFKCCTRPHTQNFEILKFLEKKKFKNAKNDLGIDLAQAIEELEGKCLLTKCVILDALQDGLLKILKF